MGVPYTAELRLELAIERGIIVDEQDHWLLSTYTWSIDFDGYPRTSVRRPDGTWQGVKLHHAIMGLPIHEGIEIDHINRNTVDNRRVNLRYVTKSEQAINRIARQRDVLGRYGG